MECRVEIPLTALEKRCGDGAEPQKMRIRIGYAAREPRRANCDGRKSIETAIGDTQKLIV